MIDREKKRANDRRYRHSSKGRARDRRYNKSDKGQARYRRYESTDNGKLLSALVELRQRVEQNPELQPLLQEIEELLQREGYYARRQSNTARGAQAPSVANE